MGVPRVGPNLVMGGVRDEQVLDGEVVLSLQMLDAAAVGRGGRGKVVRVVGRVWVVVKIVVGLLAVRWLHVLNSASNSVVLLDRVRRPLLHKLKQRIRVDPATSSTASVLPFIAPEIY